MSYDEWKATEPHWDGAQEYVPCASVNCPMMVKVGDELCDTCRATEERAKKMGWPTQFWMMSHCDNPDHLIRQIRRAL